MMLKWSKFAFNLLSTFFKCRFNRSWMILRLVFAIAMLVPVYSDFAVDCSNLQIGQYSCDLPIMDLATQQPFNCMPNDTASVNCTLIEGLQCTDTGSSNFTRPIRCDYTNGYSFETALLLAIFLGMFGADRFYLGYPAIGLLKFATLGGCFIFQLIDILLIAMQLLRPADNSHYVMKYFGPKLTIVENPQDFELVSEEFVEYMASTFH